MSTLYSLRSLRAFYEKKPLIPSIPSIDRTIDHPSTIDRPVLWLRAAVLIVNIGIVGLMAQSLAGIGLAIWEGMPVSLEQVTTSNAVADKTPLSTVVDYQTIADWQLFGRPEARHAAITAPAPPTPEEVAPLNLRLVGVFFAEKANYSNALALIAEGTNVERGYRPGEPLPGGAELVKIAHDHVIVSRKGRQETFALPKRSDFGSLVTPPAPSPTQNSAEETMDPMAGMEESAPPMPVDEETLSEPPQQPRPEKRRRFPMHHRGMP